MDPRANLVKRGLGSDRFKRKSAPIKSLADDSRIKFTPKMRKPNPIALSR